LLAACSPPPRPSALLARLPLLKLPLHLDSTWQARPVPVSRQEVWNELLLPVNGFVVDSTEPLGFPVDSESVVIYHQWDSLDLHKRERTIPYYSPVFSGELFALGKVALHDGVTGVLWGFDEVDPIYGTGLVYWLVVPGARPGKAEYRQVYQHQRAGFMEPDFFYQWAELRPGQVTLHRHDKWRRINRQTGMPEGQWLATISRQVYRVTPRGLLPPGAADPRPWWFAAPSAPGRQAGN
jgi:hypothetical protein